MLAYCMTRHWVATGTEACAAVMLFGVIPVGTVISIYCGPVPLAYVHCLVLFFAWLTVSVNSLHVAGSRHSNLKVVGRGRNSLTLVVFLVKATQ